MKIPAILPVGNCVETAMHFARSVIRLPGRTRSDLQSLLPTLFQRLLFPQDDVHIIDIEAERSQILFGHCKRLSVKRLRQLGA